MCRDLSYKTHTHTYTHVYMSNRDLGVVKGNNSVTRVTSNT